MKTLKDYQHLQGQIITAISANNYSSLHGKCVSVRETIASYTDVRDNHILVDVENAGLVSVGLANTARIAA